MVRYRNRSLESQYYLSNMHTLPMHTALEPHPHSSDYCSSLDTVWVDRCSCREEPYAVFETLIKYALPGCEHSNMNQTHQEMRVFRISDSAILSSVRL